MDFFGLFANILDGCMLVLGKYCKFLNAKKIRICFLFEIICLLYWMYMNFNRGLYSQMASCVVSIMICIYGYREWGKLSNNDK
jgi:nicotinamide riboside transporter PnuC